MFDNDTLDEIDKRKNEWDSTTLGKVLEKYPEREERFSTISNVEVNRVYTPLDVADLNYANDLGLPGEYPYTRGVQPTMYRGRLWTMRQYAGFGSAEDTNKRYKYLLEQGQTGLSVAFDLPTQMGYDSDHPMAQGEVGKVGVTIDSIRDMEMLFDGIPLDKVSTSMTINSTAAILLAMYIVVAEGQGVSQDQLRGTIQNDVLKEYVARGTYIFPPAPSMRIITDILAFCSQNISRWNSISISGYHIREAGSTAIQEVAFTLANGMAYVEAAMKAGLKVDDFGPRLSFFFNSHNDLLEEVAKFRAARRLWARTMKEKYGAEDPRSWMLRFHTQTAGCSLTAQQPENNIVRVTLQALAAVLGGTQSLHTNSMDEALALPSEKAVRIALRTQQLVGYESGVTNTIDPLAGSYYVEALTGEIEEGAMKYFDRIADIGNGSMLEGAVRGIEQGFFQREIADASYRYQREVESQRRVVVGVNKFTIEEEELPKDLLKVDPAVQKRQEEKLQKLKSERDDARVRKALDALHDAASGEENVMHPILECVRAHVTLGEMCDVLRDVFGVYKEQVLF